MPGPQTQHKGTVYGEDENAPKPGLGPLLPLRRGPLSPELTRVRALFARAAAGCGLHVVTRSCWNTMPRRRPTLLWADRLDKLFITVLLPQLQGPAVSLLPSGSLQLNATSEAAALVVDLQLHSEVLPGESDWFAREHKVELTIAKAVRGRWAQLLKTGHEYAGELRTDWQKYLDNDDEIDDLERKSGQRGPPVQGNPGFARAVDEYWRRQRVERRQSDQLPDLDAVSKLAEKEHARTGGDFNAIVQRLWAEARRELEQQREHERREDAWAAGEALEEAPALEQAPPQSASGEIRRRLSPAAESETPVDMPIANPPVTPADASSATTPRKSAKRKKRPPRKSRTADEL